MITLKEHIINETIFKTYPKQPILIFYGDEHYVRNIYIKKIGKVLKREIRREDDIEKTLRVGTSILDSRVKFLNVVIDDYECFENGSIEKVKEPTILVLNTVDKTRKYYKKYEELFIEFKELDNSIIEWVYKDRGYETNKWMQDLIQKAGPYIYNIDNELNKIKMYSKCRTLNAGQSYKELSDSKVLCENAGLDIFNLIEMLSSREKKAVAHINMVVENKGTLGFLSLLHASIKCILCVKCYRGNNIAQDTGLNNYQLLRAGHYSRKGNWKAPELKEILMLIESMDSDIKSGKYTEFVALNLVVLTIFKN